MRLADIGVRLFGDLDTQEAGAGLVALVAVGDALGFSDEETREHFPAARLEQLRRVFRAVLEAIDEEEAAPTSRHLTLILGGADAE